MSEIDQPKTKNEALGELMLKQILFNRSVAHALGFLASGKRVNDRDLAKMVETVDEMQTGFGKLLSFLLAEDGV